MGKNSKVVVIRARLSSGVVLQGDHHRGCGVACVASVLNVSYEAALDLFSGCIGDDHTRGDSRRALIAALSKGGPNTRFMCFGRLDSLTFHSSRSSSFTTSSIRPGITW
jgi:hypothetical protein